MAVTSLDWFITLVEQGTFTRAAEELQIPQQTLSARLASLEKELGSKLLTRTTPLGLTRAGEAFLSYAEDQHTLRTKMLRQVSEVTVGGFGQLRVGISNMRGRVLMPYVLKQFHESLPGVRIKLIEGTNEELVRLAERGEADLVLATFGDTHPGVEVHPLYEEEVVLAVEPNLLERTLGMPCRQAVTHLEMNGLGALKDFPFLLEYSDDISGRIGRAQLRKAGIKAEGWVESENLMTLLALCVAGQGGVFCPTNMLDATKNLTGNLARIHLSHGARYRVDVGVPANAEPWLPTQMFEDVLGALYGEKKDR